MVVWNLDDIYKKEEHEQRLKTFKESVDSFLEKKSFLTDDIEPKVFLELLESFEDLHRQASFLSARVGLQAVEDITNPDYKKEEQQVGMFLTEQSNKLLFFTHFFKNLSDDKAKEIIDDAGRFTYYLQAIRRAKPFSRTESEEQIMNLKDLTGDEALGTIRDLVVGKLTFPFQGKDLLEPEVRTKAMSESEDERREAYESLMSVYEKNKDILCEVYKNISLDWYNESVLIRGHHSSISARNFSNALSDDVVQLVLDTVTEQRVLFQDFFKLKTTFLGIENTRHNVYAPYPLKDKKSYPYDEAEKIMFSVFEDFSDEMYSLAKRVVDKQHIHSDILPHKRGGAFCYSFAKDEVPYVMLNHMDRLDDVSTFCHEVGHSIHGQLASHTTEFTFHSSIALAEVASIFSELLLKEKLLKTASPEEKKYLLIKELDGAFASILRQVYFVKFEVLAHDKVKDGVTVDELNEVYLDLLKEQFGSTSVPEHFKHEWIAIPHIYNSPFYCYSYAFANLVVYALYHELKKEGKESFVPKYLNILRSGGDADVVDILSTAGFDITKKDFWLGAFDEIRLVLDELKDVMKG